MAEIIWTENALLELREVLEYIDLVNPQAAKALATKVFSSAQRLEDQPKSCPLVNELPDMEFRQLLVGPLRLLYQHNADTISIVHIVRQERELKRICE